MSSILTTIGPGTAFNSINYLPIPLDLTVRKRKHQTVVADNPSGRFNACLQNKLRPCLKDTSSLKSKPIGLVFFYMPIWYERNGAHDLPDPRHLKITNENPNTQQVFWKYE